MKDRRDYIPICCHTGEGRCSCGAIPGAYHSQICGDANTIKGTGAEPGELIALYDKEGRFAGHFAATRSAAEAMQARQERFFAERSAELRA